MPETRSNLLTKTRPKSTSLHPQASTFPPTKQKMMYKSTTIASTIPEKTAIRTPVEIGTTGTVGSLIMKEIEYFNQLELGCQEKSERPRSQLADVASTSSYSRPKLGSLITAPKKKKKGGSKLIPSMCSTVEVAESTRPSMISGFNYRNLKADVKKLA